MMWLRQSTVSVINFGPVLDFADGVTLETAAGIITSLDHAVTGIMLSKNGGTLTVREQGANFVATSYDAHGCFKVSLSAVDTGTLGRLRVIHTEPATYLAVWRDLMVVPAQVWDSLFGADKLDVAIVEQANIDFGALQKASLNAATPAASNMRGTDNAALAIDLATVDTVVDAIKLKTDTINDAGALTWTYTLTDSVTAAPIADATIMLTSDSAGTVVLRTGTTNSSGVATFYFAPGDSGTTVYVWRSHAGYNFTNPDSEVLS